MGKHESSMEKIEFYLAKQDKRGKLTTADQIDLARELTISDMKFKLKGLCAVSTSHFGCAFCKKASMCKGSICEKCYVNKEGYKTNLHNALRRNKLILDNFELSTTALKTVCLPTEKVRIQAHGETDTSTCAKNFIRLMKSHSSNKFGVWEKNDVVWADALEELGKPKNCKLTHSSMFINKVGQPIARLVPYVDHIFTVLDEDADAPIINCGGRSCFECERCYKCTRIRKDSCAYNTYKTSIEDMGLEYRGHDYYIFEALK